MLITIKTILYIYNVGHNTSMYIMNAYTRSIITCWCEHGDNVIKSGYIYVVGNIVVINGRFRNLHLRNIINYLAVRKNLVLRDCYKVILEISPGVHSNLYFL